ncbi:Ski complex subunit Rec14 [Schizosaccharomyces osmophilus]|uniref:Ski complex subunit Rec14 n=1 Tax=Schizosaccharomyces osmophilus TaxID=2545709 RepID=A0AAF0AZY8_9SCHI|nr:Ski complex subunit Rec14 [Schizosaccharomyces osmophilus]WBW75423.1 Ski complex subunit Rec14 [Schizosaccharomyces osmophilus]
MRREYLVSHIQENAHEADIYSLCVISGRLWSCSGDSKIKQWNVDSAEHELVEEIDTPHKIGIHNMATSLDERLVVSCGFGQDVYLWDPSTNSSRSLGDSVEHPGECWAACISPDAQTISFTTVDGHVCVWDTHSNIKVADLDTKGKFGLCTAYSPNGRFIASGHQTGQLFLISTETGRLFHTLSGHTLPLRSLAFSPGSSLLAAAGDSKMITVYDVVSGDQVGQLRGHSAWIFALAFNPVGDLLLSADIEGRVKVWDMDTMECISTKNEVDGGIWAVAWYNNGFAVAGADRSILWYRAAASE